MIETLYILVVIMLLIIYKYVYKNQATYVEYFDEKFLVRNMSDKKKAGELLYKIKNDMKNLIENICNDFEKGIIKNRKMYEIIKRGKERLKNTIWKESSSENQYTSYTVNKGESVVMCLRSKKDDSFENYNELMYVSIHELSHICCDEIGHTPLFFEIKKFLLEQAMKQGIYKYIDYNRNIKDYCGIKINSNVLNS